MLKGTNCVRGEKNRTQGPGRVKNGLERAGVSHTHTDIASLGQEEVNHYVHLRTSRTKRITVQNELLSGVESVRSGGMGAGKWWPGDKHVCVAVVGRVVVSIAKNDKQEGDIRNCSLQEGTKNTDLRLRLTMPGILLISLWGTSWQDSVLKHLAKLELKNIFLVC